jgi:hypothetical protein
MHNWQDWLFCLFALSVPLTIALRWRTLSPSRRRLGLLLSGIVFTMFILTVSSAILPVKSDLSFAVVALGIATIVVLTAFLVLTLFFLWLHGDLQGE